MRKLASLETRSLSSNCDQKEYSLARRGIGAAPGDDLRLAISAEEMAQHDRGRVRGGVEDHGMGVRRQMWRKVCRESDGCRLVKHGVLPSQARAAGWRRGLDGVKFLFRSGPAGRGTSAKDEGTCAPKTEQT
jgi:hypothetical protein